MDSLTQFMLGAAVGVAVSPLKTRRVAVIAGALATLPDLDIVLNYGDELQNMIHHRGFSHSFLILSLLSLPLAWVLKKIQPKLALSFKHWFWLCFWVLNTHILLDSLTIFGTQVFFPSGVPSVMIGSMFIFDLFYTIPLLVAFVVLMRRRKPPTWFSFSTNSLALSLSSTYLVLMLLLQQYAFANTPPPQNTEILNSFTMPTPSNGLIWRTVYIDKQHSYERFYNLVTKQHSPWITIAHNKNNNVPKDRALKKIIAKYDYFAHGFYRLELIGDNMIISDKRMGRTDMPFFAFVIGKKQGNNYQAITPKSVPPTNFNFIKMFGNWN